MAIAVEFAVEDLLPRAEIEFAFGDRDDDVAAHDLTLEMRIGVVFARCGASSGELRRRKREQRYMDELSHARAGWLHRSTVKAAGRASSADRAGIDNLPAAGLRRWSALIGAFTQANPESP